jgi:hypothetical protein
MKVTTYEATVENGQIKLPEAVQLPEHATVYIVIPGPQAGSTIHIRSPRLVDRESAADFKLEVLKVDQDAGL